jgi:hypothetical protein
VTQGLDFRPATRKSATDGQLWIGSLLPLSPAHFQRRTAHFGLVRAHRVTSDFAVVKHCIGVKLSDIASKSTVLHD